MTTGASEWGKPFKEGVEIRLPSGKDVLLRPVAMDTLLAQGNVPDLLTPLVARSLWEEVAIEEVGSRDDLAAGFVKLVNFIVPAAMLKPKVIMEGDPAEDEILLEWMEFGDKVFVFQVAIQPVELMHKFRDEQIANVESVSDGETAGDET